MKRILVPILVLALLLGASLLFERLLGGERPWMNVIRHLSLGATSAWLYAETWRGASGPSFLAAPWWFTMAALVAGAVLLGVCWEIFEWSLDLVSVRTDVGDPYDDSMKDLLMDMFGSLFVAPVFLFRRRDSRP